MDDIMMETVTRKRLEVLIDTALSRKLTAAADAAGISGYTFLPVSSGKGAGGHWSDDQITGGAGAKTLFLTVTNDEKADKLVTALQPLLDSHGLVLFVSDVAVIRGNKYA
jgi:hypothetical protein